MTNTNSDSSFDYVPEAVPEADVYYADGSLMIEREGARTVWHRPDGTVFRIEGVGQDGNVHCVVNEMFDEPGPLQPDPPYGSMRTWWLPDGSGADELQYFTSGEWENMGPGYPGNTIYAPDGTIFSVVDTPADVPPSLEPEPNPGPEPLPPTGRIDWDTIRAGHPLGQVIAADRGESGGFVTCPRPEHRDSNPSTHLRDDDHWHCFGCGHDGDVVDWVAATRGVQAREAVRLLEDGAPLPPELPKTTAGHLDADAPVAIASPPPPITAKPTVEREAPPGDPERVRAALRAAWDYYRLPKLHERSLAYLAGRGIDITGLEVAGPVIGHTPAAVDGLTQQLQKRGFSDEELVAANLSALGKDGSLIDVFRHRVMLAFTDEQGVTGFIGRYDGDRENVLESWKYKNSRNTAVADKGECLYWPVGPPNPGDRVVLVEGTLDALAVAIAAQASGRLDGEQRIVPVAPSGVAMSPAQWDAIAGCAPSRVAIALDNDDTGRKFAAERLEEARQRGLDARYVEWPESTKDAAGLLQTSGPSAVLAALGAKAKGQEGERLAGMVAGAKSLPAPAAELDVDDLFPLPTKPAPVELDDDLFPSPPKPAAPAELDDPFALVPTLPAPGAPAWPELEREP